MYAILTCIHTHMYIYTTETHTYAIYTCTHNHTRMYTCKGIHSCTHVCSHAKAYTHAHTYRHVHTHRKKRTLQLVVRQYAPLVTAGCGIWRLSLFPSVTLFNMAYQPRKPQPLRHYIMTGILQFSRLHLI